MTKLSELIARWNTDEGLNRWDMIVIFAASFFTFLALLGVSVLWLFWTIQ